MLPKPPQNKRILALDVGTRTCGVAMTDQMATICQPVTTLRYKGESDQGRVFEALLQIFLEHTPIIVVVGLPLVMNGSEGIQSGKIRKFVGALKKYLGRSNVSANKMEWVYFDESLTSRDAHSFLASHAVSHAKRKKIIDKMAAVLILQAYLDEKNAG